ncbi:hypothetical protein Ciccas_012959, partial [Cichlidogyrus casuarinus]
MSAQQVKSNSNLEVKFETISLDPYSQYEISYVYSFLQDGRLYDRFRVGISKHRVFVSRNLIYLDRFSIDDGTNYSTTFVKDSIDEILKNETRDAMYDFEVCISLLFYIYLYKLTTLRFLTFEHVKESFSYQLKNALNGSKLSSRNRELILGSYQKKLEILEKSVFNEMIKQPDEKSNIDLTKTMAITEFFYKKPAPRERYSVFSRKKLILNEKTETAKTIAKTIPIKTDLPKLKPPVPTKPIYVLGGANETKLNETDEVI